MDNKTITSCMIILMLLSLSLLLPGVQSKPFIDKTKEKEKILTIFSNNNNKNVFNNAFETMYRTHKSQNNNMTFLTLILAIFRIIVSIINIIFIPYILLSWITLVLPVLIIIYITYIIVFFIFGTTPDILQLHYQLFSTIIKVLIFPVVLVITALLVYQSNGLLPYIKTILILYQELSFTIDFLLLKELIQPYELLNTLLN